MSSNIMQIGSYQLENLISQRTKFIYFDLSPVTNSIAHPLLSGSKKVRAEELVAAAEELAPDKQHPIVLICETGAGSVSAAEILEGAGFINLFVIRGGIRAL